MTNVNRAQVLIKTSYEKNSNVKGNKQQLQSIFRYSTLSQFSLTSISITI